VSEVSEAELGEWEQGAEAEELGAGGGGANYHYPRPRLTSWRLQERVGEKAALSFVPSFCPSRPLGYFSFVIPLARITSSWERPGRRAAGSLQRAATAQTAGRKRTIHNLAIICLDRSHASNE